MVLRDKNEGEEGKGERRRGFNSSTLLSFITWGEERKKEVSVSDG